MIWRGTFGREMPRIFIEVLTILEFEMKKHCWRKLSKGITHFPGKTILMSASYQRGSLVLRLK